MASNLTYVLYVIVSLLLSLTGFTVQANENEFKLGGHSVRPRDRVDFRLSKAGQEYFFKTENLGAVRPSPRIVGTALSVSPRFIKLAIEAVSGEIIGVTQLSSEQINESTFVKLGLSQDPFLQDFGHLSLGSLNSDVHGLDQSADEIRTIPLGSELRIHLKSSPRQMHAPVLEGLVVGFDSNNKLVKLLINNRLEPRNIRFIHIEQIAKVTVNPVSKFCAPGLSLLAAGAMRLEVKPLRSAMSPDFAR